MKENNAPDKIYLTKNLLGELRDGWNALPSNNFINIEYTRTDVFDAFIEKAKEWLKLYILNHDNIDVYQIGEDFKNYMKGE